jgi:ferredoxin-NADP reductase
VRTPAFMADISAALAAGGIQAARIRTEVFGPGPAQTPGIAARRPHPPAGRTRPPASQAAAPRSPSRAAT